MRPIAPLLCLLLISLSLAPPARPQSGAAAGAASRTLHLDGEEITVTRDEFGVPHIFAATERGAYYAGGYAVAEDRLFQLERYRRDARGQLAEIEGPRAVARDQQVRTLGYTEAELQAAFERMRPELRAAFQAYADGINARMQEVFDFGEIPEGFKRAGLAPAPWRVTDSVAIGIMMAHRFGSSGGIEILNARVFKRLRDKFGEAEAKKVLDDLYWLNDPKSPTTIPEEESPSPQQTGAARRLPDLPFDRLDDAALAAAERVAEQREVFDYGEANQLPGKWGSYAWVIGPARSASGNPMLVGGPQMGFSTPQIAHEIHYAAGGLNVIGMGFAGVPGVLIGFNENLVWTTTSGITDMVDIFAEKIDPQNRYRYFHKGAWHDMEKRVETIKVKGEAPKVIEVYRTVHGPVIGWDVQAGLAFSRAASFAGNELSNLEAFYGFNRARTVEEFGMLCAFIYTNHNFFAADREGNIGYWHAGKPPLRAGGQDPRLPTPGTGEHDWRGLVPFARMPQVVNPRQGFLVNWNNKPARWWNNEDRPVWGEIFRIHHINKLVRAHERLTFDQTQEIARLIGTRDFNADYLKPHLLEAIRRTDAAARDPRVREAAAHLAAWDNEGTDGSVAKTIFDAWLDAVRDAIFADEFKELDAIGALSGERNFFDQLMQPSLILHVLEGEKSGVPPSRDYFNGRPKDEVVVEALARALGELAEKRGPQMNLWGYRQGDINFRPLPGIPRTNRGTYIQVVELSRPLIRAVSILPPGQSEDQRSPHYGDQREMAGYWRYKPMLYRREMLPKPANAAGDARSQ